ncbi:hypothetical protein GCM10019059_44840 [Camelimonas fluminis]|nr:hypothetical protein GCM10019059_44840 [Camelimonas fluminis]
MIDACYCKLETRLPQHSGGQLTPDKSPKIADKIYLAIVRFRFSNFSYIARYRAPQQHSPLENLEKFIKVLPIFKVVNRLPLVQGQFFPNPKKAPGGISKAALQATNAHEETLVPCQ